MMLLTPRMDQPINWVNPVDWQCPLNRGLVSWWLCAPGVMGGSRFIDLCGKNHGTLTNMDPASDWVPSSHPGGMGALDFDGTNDYVTAPLTSSLTTFSMSHWVYKRTGGTYSHMCEGGFQSFIHSSGDWYFVAYSGYIVPHNVWVHLTATVSAATSTVTLYRDGTQVYTRGTSLPTFSTPVILGKYFGGASEWWNGQIDDVAIHNRALSATEAMALYQDSRLGHPQMLNRIRRPLFSGAVAAAGGNRRRRVLCGA